MLRKTNNFVYGLVVTAVSAVALTGTAQAASVTGDAGATVVAPVTISQTTAIAFGTFAADASLSGTLELTTGGTITATNVDHLGLGDQTAGEFSVSGSGSTAYSVALPSSITLSGSGGPDMIISSLNTTALPTSGTDSFNIGGTLAVAAAQGAGSYTGTYTVTVSYD